MHRRLIIFTLGLIVGTARAGAAPTDEVTVLSAKTSLFLNSLTLGELPLRRTGTRYETSYTVKVFPIFFYGENGRFAIEVPEADLARLRAGTPIAFKGEAENTDHEKRHVEGTATPADASSGRIKVKIFVTAKLALTFDTTYRFTGK